MKKFLWIFLTLIVTGVSFGEYQQGDVVENIEFTAHSTDGTTIETSIYDQVDQGKTVLIFWGESW